MKGEEVMKWKEEGGSDEMEGGEEVMKGEEEGGGEQDRNKKKVYKCRLHNNVSY